MERDDIRRAAALHDPLRRRIFELVRRARRPLTREDVAAHLGISRKLAAFHLDKLLERGLLVAHFARPPGRAGPGAGRTAKFYEPADPGIQLTIPERRYDLAGALLIDAMRAEVPGERARDAAIRIAREYGRARGQQVRRARSLRPLGPERALAIAEEVLEEDGYEPYRASRRVLALRNCPFHSLAQKAPELMCGMNQAYIDGLLRGLGNETVEAALECAEGDCCVTLRAPPPRR